MRLNLSHNSQHQLSNQSLLSQSLSDLRSSSANQQQVPMIFNQSNNSNLFYRNSTPVRKKSCHSENFNNNCDEDLLEEQNYIATSPNSNVNAVDRLSRIASPDSMATMTPTSSQVSFAQCGHFMILREINFWDSRNSQFSSSSFCFFKNFCTL